MPIKEPDPQMSDRILKDLAGAADWKERMVLGPQANYRFTARSHEYGNFVFDELAGEFLPGKFPTLYFADTAARIANQVAALVRDEMLAEFGRKENELENEEIKDE